MWQLFDRKVWQNLVGLQDEALPDRVDLCLLVVSASYNISVTIEKPREIYRGTKTHRGTERVDRVAPLYYPRIARPFRPIKSVQKTLYTPE